MNFILKHSSYLSSSNGLCPEATVTTIWKTAICKWGILKLPIFNVLSFRGWIKLIFDTVYECNFIINEFNRISKVQNIENGVFQNAPFANVPGVFQTVSSVASGLGYLIQNYTARGRPCIIS